MKLLILLLAIIVAGCATPTNTVLVEMTPAERDYWEMFKDSSGYYIIFHNQDI